MDQSNFHQDTRYTVTLRDESQKLRPANLYVMKKHKDGMVVRMTDKDGRLTKINYDDVIKIVNEQKVNEQERFYVPDAVLAENNWKDRKTLEHYSSSPHRGK